MPKKDLDNLETCMHSKDKAENNTKYLSVLCSQVVLHPRKPSLINMLYLCIVKFIMEYE